MKKLLLVVGLLVMGTLVVTAQSPEFGLKAGLNVATVKVSNGTDISSRTGYHIGGLAHIHVAPNWAVQPELVFSTQGGKQNEVTIRENYLNVPILVQYMTNTGFRLETGPQVGFLLSADHKNGKIVEDVKDQMTAADLSWALGASYLCKSGVGFDARYNFGLTNINTISSPEAKNMVFQVGVFYQFNH